MRSRLLLFAFVAICGVGCAPSRQPGMTPFERRPDPTSPERDEVARVEPRAGYRALLVAYPRTACSGSARTVLLDDDGAFLGAIGPGEGALLAVANRSAVVRAISSVDVTAPVGTWFAVDEIRLEPPPSGLLLESRRIDAKRCANGQYADSYVVTKAKLEEAIADLRWLTPQIDRGTAWLSAHRERLHEILTDRTPLADVEGDTQPSRVRRRVRLP